MENVSPGGDTLSMPEGDFLALVQGEVRAAHSVAQMLCGLYNVGGADTTGQLGTLVALALQSLGTIGPRVEDRELCDLLEALCAELRRLAQINDALVAVVAGFAGLPPVRDGRGREKLRRRLDKYGSVGPMWLFQPEFQQLAREAVQVFAAADQMKQRIEVRLAQLRAVLSPQAGETLAQETARLLVDGAAARAYWLATLLSSRHAYGLGDVTGQWASLAQETLAELGRLAAQVDDEALRTLIEGLGVEMERLVALSQRVVEEVAQSVGLALPRDREERDKLRRRLEAEGGEHPVWPSMPSLRLLSEETVQVAAAVNAIKQRIDARLAELRAGDGSSAAAGS